MHKTPAILYAIMTTQEAANLWGYSRNTLSLACKEGRLPGRQSKSIWLITVADMVKYAQGRLPAEYPAEMEPALRQALREMALDRDRPAVTEPG